MLYQLGWTTLPGLRGLSCSAFRATATTSPDNERGAAVEFAGDDERDVFLRQLEEHFAARRVTNAAGAFYTVEAYSVGTGSKSSEILVGGGHGGPRPRKNLDTAAR